MGAALGCDQTTHEENRDTDETVTGDKEAAAAGGPGESADGAVRTASEDHDEKQKIAAQGRSRRAGVAAESVSKDDLKNYKKPVYPKSDEQKQRLLNTLKTHDKMQVLIGHLDQEKMRDLVNAFAITDIALGTDIITQGAEGDSLYIVDEGTADIFVARPAADGKPTGERGNKVLSVQTGALFGELALMYNAPRAATVCASSAVKAFKLDAVDFKMLLAQSAQAQLQQYEGWLKEVDLLKSLNQFELTQLADALESEVFDPGEDIIVQGADGDKFYILEEGKAAAFISGKDGEKQVKSYDKKGDYFGELALLNKDDKRKATVRCGEACSVVSLSKEDFEAHLGPMVDILRKNEEKYPQYAEFLK